LLALALGACATVAADPRVAATATTSVAVAESTIDLPAASPTISITPTPSVKDWLQPYTLAGLRARDLGEAKLLGRERTLKTSLFTRYAITYLSEGLRITGTMQIPTSGKPPYPAIIMDHGFFNRTEYVTGDGTDRAAEYLNRHGYLTLASDYRSWGGSEAGPSLFYSGLAIDVYNLIRAAKGIPEADMARIGIWGHSMGGGVTMKVLAMDTPVKAAVLYSTVSADDADILGRWGLGCIGDIEAGENQLGCNSSDVVPLDLPPELIQAYYEASMDPDMLALTSPIHNLQFVHVPVQIHYGTKDGLTMAGTPPAWSRKLFDALQAANIPAEIYGYDDQGHSFVGDSWVAFMERSAHFYDKYVKAAS
jgi:dipeptidyl aminopeptidase/acylaminoacyl peptidase